MKEVCSFFYVQPDFSSLLETLLIGYKAVKKGLICYYSFCNKKSIIMLIWHNYATQGKELLLFLLGIKIPLGDNKHF